MISRSRIISLIFLITMYANGISKNIDLMLKFREKQGYLTSDDIKILVINKTDYNKVIYYGKPKEGEVNIYRLLLNETMLLEVIVLSKTYSRLRLLESPGYISDNSSNSYLIAISPSDSQYVFSFELDNIKDRSIKLKDFTFFFVHDKTSGSVIKNDSILWITKSGEKPTKIDIKEGWAKLEFKESLLGKKIAYKVNISGYEKKTGVLKLDFIEEQNLNIIELVPNEVNKVSNGKNFNFNVAFLVSDFNTGKGIKGANIDIGIIGQNKENIKTDDIGWSSHGLDYDLFDKALGFRISKRGYRALDPMYYPISTTNIAEVIQVSMEKTKMYGIAKSKYNKCLFTVSFLFTSCMSYKYYKDSEDYKKEYNSLPYGSQRFDNVWEKYVRSKENYNMNLGISITNAVWLIYSCFW